MIGLLAVGVSIGALAAGCGRPAVADAGAGRSRAYSNFQACLLTDGGGISARATASVWAGMQDASAKTKARVSYLSVTGPQTEADAETFLGSLLVRGCGVIVASGQAEGDAVRADAARFPKTRFAVIAEMEGPAAPHPPNIRIVTGDASAIRSGVADLVTQAAQDASKS